MFDHNGDHMKKSHRGVAKFGIALGLGPRDFAGSNPVTPTKIAAMSAQKPQETPFCGFFLFLCFFDYSAMANTKIRKDIDYGSN